MIEDGHLFGFSSPLVDRAHYSMRNSVVQAYIGGVLIIHVAEERARLSQSLDLASQLIALLSIKLPLFGDFHLDARSRRETRPGNVVDQPLADNEWRSAVEIFRRCGRL